MSAYRIGCLDDCRTLAQHKAARIPLGGRHFCITPLYFPTFFWPLQFSGLYFSRATTSLWPLPFKKLGVLYCMESYGRLP
jgi:hypothetical protein